MKFTTRLPFKRTKLTVAERIERAVREAEGLTAAARRADLPVAVGALPELAFLATAGATTFEAA